MILSHTPDRRHSIQKPGFFEKPGFLAHASARAFGVVTILISLSGSPRAQDAEPAPPLTVDEQTVAPTEPPDSTSTAPEEQPAGDLPELAGRIIAGMRSAESRLAGGRLDEETGDLQDRINADLTKLLSALERQASQPAPVPGEDSQQQTAGGDTSSTGGTGNPGAPGGNSSDGESTEGDRPGELTDSELQHRRNLATSVWGHLPEKERDEMLGTFSERFLPAYDELVRQYYEALATRKSPEQ